MEQLPTWTEIDLGTLGNNLRVIRGELEKHVRILLTVKADAYGHGAVRVAQAAEPLVDHFGVATLDEALELKSAAITKPILIMSPVLTGEIPAVVDNDFSLTVRSPEFAADVSEYAAREGKRASVHVEVDTGMGRTGFFSGEALSLIDRVSELVGLRLAGVFTHFPVSESDVALTHEQLKSFREFAAGLRDRLPAMPLLHSANSAAVLTDHDSHLDLVRPGLAAYGCLPGDLETRLAIEPVMQWRTKIVQIRNLPAGWRVSYGGTCETSRDTTMGVLPVGYGHGYPHSLSNRGEVLTGGRRAPILGRVTMDMTMVDLTDIRPEPEVEDEVVLLGRQGEGLITAGEVAAWAGTISYEILCGVGKRVPRIYPDKHQ